MTTSFTQADALTALGTYGAAFERWPDQSLAAYVQADPSLQAHIKQAQHLDAQLSTSQSPVPSDLLKERILKAASQMPQEASALRPAANDTAPQPNRFKTWTRMAAILLASAIVGGTVWINQSPAEQIPVLTAELDAETDAWRSAANDLDMMDIFLWVETDDTAS